MVCLRNINVDTLHKGDTEDNNNNRMNGTVSKSLRQYLSNIPGKHEIKEMQVRAILGAAHVLREVLM